jgi:hypothetical protein
METSAERFDDGGAYLWQLADAFLVRCPRCDKAARVARDADRKVRLTCAHCGLARSQAFDPERWMGPVCAYLDGRCGGCGQRIERRPRRLARPPAKGIAMVTCGRCGYQTERPVRWWPIPAEARDPLFGLPLWLQAPCRGHTLWAFGERHLAFLEQWVGATLRHRQPHRNGSLASRLPRWMTEASARDDVLECLGRLRALLPGG